MLVGFFFSHFPIRNIVLLKVAFLSDSLAPEGATILLETVYNVLNRAGKKSFRLSCIRTPVHPPMVFPAVNDNIYFLSYSSLGNMEFLCYPLKIRSLMLQIFIMNDFCPFT